jgi:SynChlorMet cassette radical SAM/SPASM protein ScmF
MNRLNALYCYITRGCNLQCRHCYMGAVSPQDPAGSASMDPRLLAHVVRQAKPLGLSYVKLGGGEPLLHPRIGEILEIARREEIRITVTTNGTLCTPAMVRDLARNRLWGISVSLDGTDAATHEWVRNSEGCFEKTIRGIRALVEGGISPQLSMSVLRINAGQMEAFVRLAESLGASSVQFNLVEPTGRGAKVYEDGETLTVSELVRLGRWVEHELSCRAGIPVFFTLPIAFRPLGRMYGTGGTGCGSCSILDVLGVLADGSYALCGAGERVPELIFGHAGRDSLEDVWRDAPLLKELRDGLPRRFRGICGECLLKGICQGRCIAQNYYKSRDFWAPFWFCEEADKEGLFPESRKQLRPNRDLRESLMGLSREKIEEVPRCT